MLCAAARRSGQPALRCWAIGQALRKPARYGACGRCCSFIYRNGGRWAFRGVLYPVVGYYLLTHAQARAASRQYLRRLGACCPGVGIRGTLADSYRHFYSFSETLLDKFSVWLDGIRPEQIEFHNRARFLALLEQRRCVLLLGGHVGNLEICRAVAELRDLAPINVLVHTRHAEKFNRLLESVVQRGRIELIQVTELNPAIAIQLDEKLRAGQFLFMVGDRIPVSRQGRTVTADFLGEPAHFPIGPYSLAAILRCPIYTLFSYPFEGRYHIHLDGFVESVTLPRPAQARQQALSRLAQRYARVLETHCRRVPLQWFNFYAFWNTPAGYNSQNEVHA